MPHACSSTPKKLISWYNLVAVVGEIVVSKDYVSRFSFHAPPAPPFLSSFLIFLYYFLPNSNIQLVNCDDTKDSNWTNLRLPIHCQFIYDDSQYSFLLYFIFGHLHLLLSTLIVIVFLLIQIAIIYIYR